ncbi:Cytochrome P450 3A24 [Sarcoptes scabiei]|uniref:Cytochrome P450 3A24 n=1 Tax=Sarcoptes scabiei TaxID=52283 RepID=A0A834VB01_SARSC|nr:Cytochrome P450 3A24 [Sarcoptes scabiei]
MLAFFEGLVENRFFFYSFSILVLLVIVALAVLEWQEYRTKRKFSKQKVRYVRSPSSFLCLAFNKRFDLIENEIMKKNGPIYGCNFLGKPTIVIDNPEIVQLICHKEFHKFANHRSISFGDPIFDILLFAAENAQWKRLRAIVSPAFSSGKLKKIKYVIDKTIQTMKMNLDENIRTNSCVDIKELLGSFSIDTIIQMAFGLKVNSMQDPNNYTVKMAKQIFEEDITLRDTVLFCLGWTCPWLAKFFGFRFKPEAVSHFKKLTFEIFIRKRDDISRNDTKLDMKRAPINFIDLLLEVEKDSIKSNGSIENRMNQSFKHINEEEIMAQCVTFFMLGYSTTATSLTNALYLLTHNQAKQEKLYLSIMKVIEQLRIESPMIEDPFDLITAECLSRFEYLNAVLLESLRLKTIVPAVDRVASEDANLETSDGKICLEIKQGDAIRILVENMHEDPRNFSNPEQFVPERFMSQSDCIETCNKQAFLPFGTGPRHCIAKNFALLEMKLALLHLIRLYRFKVDELTKSKMDYYVNADLVISKNVIVKVEKRSI